MENIKSYQLLLTSTENKNYSQLFNSNTQSELQGAIKSWDLINENILKKDKDMISEVTIDAVVIKYDSKPDIKFDTFVEGIKGAYNNNDNLTFSLKTTQDCYLTIFVISDKEASVMYPNSYEKPKKLIENIQYNFPIEKIDYKLTLTNDKSRETNHLFFVFTKSQIPFIKMNKEGLIPNQDDIFTWMYSIEPNQRKLTYQSVIIVKP